VKERLLRVQGSVAERCELEVLGRLVFERRLRGDEVVAEETHRTLDDDAARARLAELLAARAAEGFQPAGLEPAELAAAIDVGALRRLLALPGPVRELDEAIAHSAAAELADDSYLLGALVEDLRKLPGAPATLGELQAAIAGARDRLAALAPRLLAADRPTLPRGLSVSLLLQATAAATLSDDALLRWLAARGKGARAAANRLRVALAALEGRPAVPVVEQPPIAIEDEVGPLPEPYRAFLLGSRAAVTVEGLTFHHLHSQLLEELLGLRSWFTGEAVRLRVTGTRSQVRLRDLLPVARGGERERVLLALRGPQAGRLFHWGHEDRGSLVPVSLDWSALDAARASGAK